MATREEFLADPRNVAAAESFLRHALEALHDVGGLGRKTTKSAKTGVPGEFNPGRDARVYPLHARTCHDGPSSIQNLEAEVVDTKPPSSDTRRGGLKSR